MAKKKKKNIDEVSVESISGSIHADKLELIEDEQDLQGKPEASESNLVPLNIEMYPTHIALPCSVFIRVADKFVLFRNQGERLSAKRILELQSRNVSALYINKAFWNFFLETLENLRLPENSSKEQQSLHMRHLLVAYGQELDKKLREPKKPAFDRLKLYCEKLADEIKNDRELGFKLLRKNTDPILFFINHSVNVAVFNCLIGMRLQLQPAQLQILTFGGLVHDIGNLYLPKRLLYKNTQYTEDEELELQTHARRGAELLQSVGAHPSAVMMASQHHEYFNGEGYPAGMAEEEIHQFARICALSDIFDNLTSKRPNVDPVSPQEAIIMMREMTGRFDPKMLEQVDSESLSEGTESTHGPHGEDTPPDDTKKQKVA